MKRKHRKLKSRVTVYEVVSELELVRMYDVLRIVYGDGSELPAVFNFEIANTV